MNIFAQNLTFVPANELEPRTVKTMVGAEKPKWYRECKRCKLDHAHAGVWVRENIEQQTGKWIKIEVCPKCYLYLEERNLFSTNMGQAQAQHLNYMKPLPRNTRLPNSAFYSKI